MQSKSQKSKMGQDSGDLEGQITSLYFISRQWGTHESFEQRSDRVEEEGLEWKRQEARGSSETSGHWQKGETEGGPRHKGHYGDRVNVAWWGAAKRRRWRLLGWEVMSLTKREGQGADLGHCVDRAGVARWLEAEMLPGPLEIPAGSSRSRSEMNVLMWKSTTKDNRECQRHLRYIMSKADTPLLPRTSLLLWLLTSGGIPDLALPSSSHARSSDLLSQF